MGVIMRRRFCITVVAVVCLQTVANISWAAGPASSTSQPAADTLKPTLVMMPPGFENGRCFRELFEQPEAWKRTRSLIDTIGYADHNLNRQFTDEQLGAWLPMVQRWGLKLELEIGAVKHWGPTAEKTFDPERKMWDRFIRVGGTIHAISMDEPLCSTRKELHQPDDYGVAETAKFIALVRKNYPQFLIGDIEPYPFIPLADLTIWIDSLQKRLKEMNVRGLDYFRLDVNWAEFTAQNRGNWREVKKIEQFCRQRGIPFSLIYWASGLPDMRRRGLADDSTWYVSVMQQGYDYTLVDGRPDQYVIESWVDAPSHSVPETGEFTFTRSVRDFAEKFVKRPQTAASQPEASH